ncbi:MAG: hypothetical protein ACOVOX_13805, partial [Burkholderiaceae bacterium]
LHLRRLFGGADDSAHDAIEDHGSASPQRRQQQKGRLPDRGEINHLIEILGLPIAKQHVEAPLFESLFGNTPLALTMCCVGDCAVIAQHRVAGGGGGGGGVRSGGGGYFGGGGASGAW